MGASLEAEKAFQNQYPAVFKHLLSFKKELENRNKAETGIRYEWYALQRWGASYWEDFYKQKIVWKRIGSKIRFSYDAIGYLCLDSTCFAIGSDIEFLVGYLNSSICRYLLLSNSPKTGTGDVITSVQALEPLMIPNILKENKKRIIDLIKGFNSNNNNINNRMEEEIDEIIFNSYQINEDEKKEIAFKLAEG